MKYYVMTLFPEMFEQVMGSSIMGKAIDQGLIELEIFNIRDFTLDKHNKVDDYPYGGGAGMVMEAEPIYRCYEEICSRAGKRPAVVYMTPQGEVFSQRKAESLSTKDEVVFLCGHYEGVDERVLEEIVTDYLSIGDYVLTGGELAAAVMADAIVRIIPGVISDEQSALSDSFQDNLLEYPQYSRPEEWHGKKVPPVLLSGHHANIEKWRREQSILRTYERRPDLLEKSSLTWKEKKWLEETVKEKTVHEEPEDVTECTN